MIQPARPTAAAPATPEPRWKRSLLWQTLRHLRGRVRKALDKGGRLPSRRHATPYATHLPVLIAVANVIRPQTLVEYGSGLISTPAFLDRTLFPDLQTAISFEDDADWMGRVAAATDDDRLSLRLADGAVAAAVDAVNVDAADLILIDDSCAAADRAATIAAVLRFLPRSGPTTVLVHDAETPEYLATLRDAVALGNPLDGATLFVFDAFEPHTACLSTAPLCTLGDLRTINREIARSAEAVAPDDTAAWASLLAPPKRSPPQTAVPS